MTLANVQAPRRIQLLVSVRSAREVRAALAGGADVIDVKEPANGSMGAAEPEVIREVASEVARRVRISAACGELLERRAVPRPPVLDYVKWGVANLQGVSTWRDQVMDAIGDMHFPTLGVVAAYADWQRANAPSVDEIVDFVCESVGILLIDTFVKDGKTLLDWLPLPDIKRLCDKCKELDASVALAGSLGLAEIEKIVAVAQPDWIAVRGAACGGKDRNGAIREDLVRELAASLHCSASRER